MNLTGHSIIAGHSIPGTAGTISGRDPATNQSLDPAYSLLSTDQLAVATAAAAEAHATFSALPPSVHAQFLEAIADNIEALGADLIERATQETGLPTARLEGERARTTGQLRLFASVVREGAFRGIRIDPAQPGRTPTPRVDIRQRQVPLGPVAVFGASNFPLAFSTAGGDTASALAAGCPVVFKAHNAHPGTSELVGRAVSDAVRGAGLHPGVFSLVYGPGSEIGVALVADPAIKAVGFTGSQTAGLALMRTAAARPEPIPVYAEMSSLNPVIIFAGALTDDVDALAGDYVTSVTGSSGQLCTSPGLLFAPTGQAGDRFVAAVGRATSAASGQTMLSEGIASAWKKGVAELASQDGVTVLGTGTDGSSKNAPAPAIYSTELPDFEKNSAMHREIFGAASLVIRYPDVPSLIHAVQQIEGQLTATLHLRDQDHEAAAQVLPAIEQKVGRILVNGWPTGVEVGRAMVHGGPFPATSDSRTTSVGTLAITRFLRPVAYQNLPQGLLPPALRDENPWNLPREIDGESDIQNS